MLYEISGISYSTVSLVLGIILISGIISEKYTKTRNEEFELFLTIIAIIEIAIITPLAIIRG